MPVPALTHVLVLVPVPALTLVFVLVPVPAPRNVEKHKVFRGFRAEM